MTITSKIVGKRKQSNLTYNIANTIVKKEQINLIYCHKLHLNLYLSCYESPKKEQVSHAFKHLIANIKSYNTDKI